MPRSSFSKNGYRSGHSVRWLRGGLDYFNLMASLISEAREEIHLQVYVLDSDATGLPIIDELCNAAARGVKVFLIVDAFGSSNLKSFQIERMIRQGIQFRLFEPFTSWGNLYLGRRLHHKVMVIDQKIALVSGMNIANRYSGKETDSAWLDYAVEIEGPVCMELASVCKSLFNRKFDFGPFRIRRHKSDHLNQPVNDALVRVRRNDFLRNRRQITESYNHAVRSSKKTITIVGGYFLPGRQFIRLLSKSSKRGVSVQVIMTRFSDVPIVKKASEFLYGRLLRAGVKIYECNTSMVHGKVAVVDGQWTTIGSYNQNHLSAYISIELNLDILDFSFSQNLQEHLEKVITEECEPITDEAFKHNQGFWAQLTRWSSYMLVRLSLRMLFAMNRIFGIAD